MSTEGSFQKNPWWRLFGFLLGIGVLIWLSIEDETTLWVVIISTVICLWVGLPFLVKLIAGGKQIILRHSLVGIGVGSAVALLAILLMALKSGIHGHGTPDFTVAQMQAVLSRIPFFVLSGFLIGLGSGLFRSTRKDLEPKET